MSDSKNEPEAEAPQGKVVGGGNPTHIAIDIAVWKATLDILGTLPYGQVEGLIPAIRNGQPMNLAANGE
jgi:hypothetical protein